MRALSIKQPWSWLIVHGHKDIENRDWSTQLRGRVGEAEIVGCVTASASPWFQGPDGFLIRNARPLPFRPWRGQLGFFEVPRDA